MNHTEHTAKSPSHRTGFFATLSDSLSGGGSGAPSLGLIGLLALALAALLAVAPAALAAEPCPNEQLRQESLLNPTTGAPFSTQLPDCRAYELVTPPFKNGFSAPKGLGLSADGSRSLVETFSGFAGAESDSNTFGAAYQIDRTPSGWTTAAISPPATTFPQNEERASTPDLGRTLWLMRRGSQSIYAADLYVREADGAFVEVGPVNPPSAVSGPPAGDYQVFLSPPSFVAASRDLTHVLFAKQRRTQFWPGDTTEESTSPSLYEYVGTGNQQPTLVGVSDGNSVVNNEQLPVGRLLSNCGISLGSFGNADTYNAISADGEVIFLTATGQNENEGTLCNGIFAPEVSELYARISGFETVPISEPTAAQCSACNTSTRSPAVFQGASEDGSKVFFLTEQELLPGAAGLNLYEYDFANPRGQKVLRLSAGSPTPEVQGVARVSEDGSHVYFVAKGVLTETPNAEGAVPSEGGDNLYVFQRDSAHPGGRLTFIATLAEGDGRIWSQNDNRRPIQTTPGGRYLVFQSQADLVPGDSSTEPQNFEYDAVTEELVRISVGQAGYPAGQISADSHSSEIPTQSLANIPPVSGEGLALSDDGSVVVFSTVGALTPGALVASEGGAESVYEYRSAGSISNGDVNLISDGTDVGQQSEGVEPGAILLGTDPTGDNVFFKAGSRLVRQDVDTQFDVYDARTNGGFPAPLTPAQCEPEQCQGPVEAPPSGVSAATPSFVGPPNPVATHKKRHHKKHHKRSHRRTTRHGRGGRQ